MLNIILKNWKIVLIIILAGGLFWLINDRNYQASENKRQTENNSQLRKADSLRYSRQILTSNELKEHLAYQDSRLEKLLSGAGIKTNRIESITTNEFYYKDTTKREFDVSLLVDAVKKSIPKSQEWTDTLNCVKTKGLVLFDGQKLKVQVHYQEFENKTDDIAYWERRQWNFIGIKTRLFGKKIITQKIFDQCGESKIINIEKK